MVYQYSLNTVKISQTLSFPQLHSLSSPLTSLSTLAPASSVVADSLATTPVIRLCNRKAALLRPPPLAILSLILPFSVLMFHLLPLVLLIDLAMGVQPQHSDGSPTRFGLDRLRQRRDHVVVLLGAVQTRGYYSNDDVVVVLRAVED